MAPRCTRTTERNYPAASTPLRKAAFNAPSPEPARPRPQTSPEAAPGRSHAREYLHATHYRTSCSMPLGFATIVRPRTNRCNFGPGPTGATSAQDQPVQLRPPIRWPRQHGDGMVGSQEKGSFTARGGWQQLEVWPAQNEAQATGASSVPDAPQAGRLCSSAGAVHHDRGPSYGSASALPAHSCLPPPRWCSGAPTAIPWEVHPWARNLVGERASM